MRVVADTNISVSGLLWRGSPATFLQLARKGNSTSSHSPHLLLELDEVLKRPRIAKQLACFSLDPQQLFESIVQIISLVPDVTLDVPVCRDPDDDMVLAAALMAQARAIVTGDDDLLSLREFQGVPILTSIECIRLLKSVGE